MAERFFYHPDPHSNVFDEAESKHLIRVLRMQKGDEFDLTDGKGGLYHCMISDDHPKHCCFEIISSEKFDAPSPFIQLMIAPTKQIDRFEWAVEKCVELGVSRISPIITEHSERTKLKEERILAIAISAMKQSKQTWLPKIDQLTNMQDLLSNEFRCQLFIAHCEDEMQRQNLSLVYEKGKDVVILIGPEGDFSQKEIESATKNGFIPVTLGRNRLRTETAAVYACSTIHTLLTL